MGAAHGHRLYFHAHSPLHRLPGHCKVLALVTFVLCVVATPSRAYWAFGLHALALVGVLVVSRVPAPFIVKRMVVETPFVVFALLLPFMSTGPRTDVLGLSVSEAGLHAGLTLLCKGTLGVAASLLLAATTEPRDILAGLERLRLPAQLVQIMAFMIRYLDVAGAEMGRMKIARESRGFQAKGLRSWPVVARSGGALFIRSYERGERVHLAMLSRGYAGTMPSLGEVAATRVQWLTAIMLPAVALSISLAAWGVAA
ncbi:MAG: cobalt ECF transporter T component CbiQ [Propionibacteriales bacterium]|nr:cobalt ECF transporter T component CbiQ [Propionibacteriales bacterium]